MITCPWCGTSYLVFQSTCSQCGGPIHPPEVVAAAAETPLIPPPAPRPISNSYAYRLMLTDTWSISSLVFVLVGGIFTLVGIGLTLGVITAFVGLPFLLLGVIFLIAGIGVLLTRYSIFQKRVLVLKTGTAAPGCITDVQENLAVSVNGRNPWTIAYEYIVGGQRYSGKVSTLTRPALHLQGGKSVYVLYLPGEPTTSSLYPHP